MEEELENQELDNLEDEICELYVKIVSDYFIRMYGADIVVDFIFLFNDRGLTVLSMN